MNKHDQLPQVQFIQHPHSHQPLPAPGRYNDLSGAVIRVTGGPQETAASLHEPSFDAFEALLILDGVIGGQLQPEEKNINRVSLDVWYRRPSSCVRILKEAKQLFREELLSGPSFVFNGIFPFKISERAIVPVKAEPTCLQQNFHVSSTLQGKAMGSVLGTPV